MNLPSKGSNYYKQALKRKNQETYKINFEINKLYLSSHCKLIDAINFAKNVEFDKIYDQYIKRNIPIYWIMAEISITFPPKVKTQGQTESYQTNKYSVPISCYGIIDVPVNSMKNWYKLSPHNKSCRDLRKRLEIKDEIEVFTDNKWISGIITGNGLGASNEDSKNDDEKDSEYLDIKTKNGKTVRFSRFDDKIRPLSKEHKYQLKEAKYEKKIMTPKSNRKLNMDGFHIESEYKKEICDESANDDTPSIQDKNNDNNDKKDNNDKNDNNDTNDNKVVDNDNDENIDDNPMTYDQLCALKEGDEFWMWNLLEDDWMKGTFKIMDEDGVTYIDKDGEEAFFEVYDNDNCGAVFSRKPSKPWPVQDEDKDTDDMPDPPDKAFYNDTGCGCNGHGHDHSHPTIDNTEVKHSNDTQDLHTVQQKPKTVCLYLFSLNFVILLICIIYRR